MCSLPWKMKWACCFTLLYLRALLGFLSEHESKYFHASANARFKCYELPCNVCQAAQPKVFLLSNEGLPSWAAHVYCGKSLSHPSLQVLEEKAEGSLLLQGRLKCFDKVKQIMLSSKLKLHCQSKPETLYAGLPVSRIYFLPLLVKFNLVNIQIF